MIACPMASRAGSAGLFLQSNAMPVFFSIGMHLLIPTVIWLVWKKKSDARAWPLFVGAMSYIVISLFRGMARVVVLNEAVAEVPMLYNLLSALLSGIAEEAGRYIVFRWVIRNYDRWEDAVTYSIGHMAAESVLAGGIVYGMTLVDVPFFTIYAIRNHIFSAALSVIVFAAVHYDGIRLVFAAVGLHALCNFLHALNVSEILPDVGYELLDLAVLVLMAFLAWRLYRQYSIPPEWETVADVS